MDEIQNKESETFEYEIFFGQYDKINTINIDYQEKLILIEKNNFAILLDYEQNEILSFLCEIFKFPNVNYHSFLRRKEKFYIFITDRYKITIFEYNDYNTIIFGEILLEDKLDFLKIIEDIIIINTQKGKYFYF